MRRFFNLIITLKPSFKWSKHMMEQDQGGMEDAVRSEISV